MLIILHPYQLAGLMVRVAWVVNTQTSTRFPVPFADQVRGRAPRKGIDLRMAFIASDVYKTNSIGGVGLGGWSRLSGQDLLA